MDREYEIMRKPMIAIAAAAVLGAATMATAAFAAPHGGGGFGGGGGGGHMGGGGAAHFGGGGGGAHFGGGAAMAHGTVGGGGFAAPRGNFAANGAAVAPGPRGNFAARGFDHDRDHRRGFGGFGYGGLYAFGGPDYYDSYDNYYGGDGCWQQQLVPTPYGMQWQMVDVCQ